MKALRNASLIFIVSEEIEPATQIVPQCNGPARRGESLRESPIARKTGSSEAQEYAKYLLFWL